MVILPTLNNLNNFNLSFTGAIVLSLYTAANSHHLAAHCGSFRARPLLLLYVMLDNAGNTLHFVLKKPQRLERYALSSARGRSKPLGISCPDPSVGTL